jgi:hypothetical protein
MGVKRKDHAFRVHPDQLEGLGPQSISDDDTNFVAASPEEAEETETGIVAAGRTIHVPTGERVVCGYDTALSRPVYRAVCAEFGPGMKVRLRRSEFFRLQQAGFIFDPEKIAANAVVDGEALRTAVAPASNGHAA